MPQIELILFVSGHSERAENAIATIKNICNDVLKGLCSFRVIDILEEPEKASEFNVLATPLLIKVSPQPIKRYIFGEITNIEKFLEALELDQSSWVVNATEPVKEIPVLH